MKEKKTWTLKVALRPIELSVFFPDATAEKLTMMAFLSGGILVMFNPLMSRPLVPAFFHSARRNPCLIS